MNKNSTTAKSNIARLNSIDSLRGLAALIVVIYHARAMLWIGLSETWRQYGLSLDIINWLGYATAPFSLGGLAVALFFVLSGYCIHRKNALTLSQNPNTKLELKQFIARRLWRIYPVYFISLCITAIIDAYLITYHPTYVHPGQDNSFFAFIMSLLSLQGLAAAPFGSNGVFWTLALELHFYAIYPLLYYISRKFGATKAISVTLIVSVIYILFDITFGFSNKLPYRNNGVPIFLPYWFTWGFGFYLAEIEAGRASIPKNFWLLSIVGAILTVPALLSGYQPLSYFTSTLVFGGLIWWSTTFSGQLFWKNIVGIWLARIGTFSYSLYAIHVPSILMFKFLLSPSGDSFKTLIPTILAIFVSIISGYLLFLLVERWTLKYPKFLQNFVK
jgi:peptidoglycan/LPS O-acetylase OafA/YrhL